MGHCTNCENALSRYGTCRACGTVTVPAGGSGPPPPPPPYAGGSPQGAYPTQPRPPAAGYPQEPQGYGHPPGGYGGPPTDGGYGAPPSPRKGSGAMIAAIAGGIFGLAGIGAAAFFFFAGDAPAQPGEILTPGVGGPAATASPSPTGVPISPEPSESPNTAPPVPPPPPPLPTEDPAPEPPPSEASLQDLILTMVGEDASPDDCPNCPFEMESVAECPDFIGEGAVDAYMMDYDAAGRGSVHHRLGVWPDAQAASAYISRLYSEYINAHGYEVVTEFPLENVKGEQVGAVAYLAGGDTDIVMWHNGRLGAFISGYAGLPPQMWPQLPY